MKLVARVLVCLSVGIFGFVAAASAASDVVLYSWDFGTSSGNWWTGSDDSAAGGQYIGSTDYGWGTPDGPLASPNDYVEATFYAPANVPFHIWLRLRATDDSKSNDSVWVQFSDALDGGWNQTYPIGSNSALAVNLEPCGGCGEYGWGWQDHAYWMDQPTTVMFAQSGAHTIRIQLREDGVQFDQVVLSPANYLSSAPGGGSNDWTILPESVGSADDSGSTATDTGSVSASGSADNGGTSDSGGSGGSDPGSTASGDGSGGGSAGNGGNSAVVVTWNLQVNDPSEWHARTSMDYIMSMSPRPQIIIVEEAHESQFGSYISELQNLTGVSWQGVFQHHCGPGGWDGSSCSSPQDEGVAVFTSFGISDSDSMYFAWDDGWHSARGAVRATVNVNGSNTNVYAIHMSNDTAGRNAAIGTLNWWAGNHGGSTIIGGDFNAGTDQIDAWSNMGAHFVDGTANVGPTCDSSNPTMQLDYLFGDSGGGASPQWAAVQYSTGTFSDHLPVLGSFSIR